MRRRVAECEESRLRTFLLRVFDWGVAMRMLLSRVMCTTSGRLVAAGRGGGACPRRTYYMGRPSTVSTICVSERCLHFLGDLGT